MCAAEKKFSEQNSAYTLADMADAYVIKFTVLTETKEDKIPEKVTVQLLKSDTQLPNKDRVVKETAKENFFDALDVGFVWLERALKN